MRYEHWDIITRIYQMLNLVHGGIEGKEIKLMETDLFVVAK